MRYTQEICELKSKLEIAPGVYDYLLYSPKIAKAAAEGQFVNVLCDGYTLRRPISICGYDKESGMLRLVFEVRGKGTDWLSNVKKATSWT